MFTGIAEEIGRLKSISCKKDILKLDIEAEKVCGDSHIGDSIACNGVCLTLVGLKKNALTFEVMKPTHAGTNLKALKKGAGVNLERAARSDSRFGGHFVTGHVDGVRRIKSFKKEAKTASLVIGMESGDYGFAIKKGSICIEGVSLTIAEVSKDTLRVDLIPHTLKTTTLAAKKAGDFLNVEFDILVKSARNKEKSAACLTRKSLEKAGFI